MAFLVQFTSALRPSCSRSIGSRCYSDIVQQRAARKWGLHGHPRPKSILEDDDAEVDLSEDNDAVNGVIPNTTPIHERRPSKKPTPTEHKAHKKAIRKEFPEGWAPPRKLSREAMDALRQLHRMDPETFKTPVLAEKFKISPEAVSRILKSKWHPSPDEQARLASKEAKAKAEMVMKRRQEEFEELRNSKSAPRLTGTLETVLRNRKDAFVFR